MIDVTRRSGTEIFESRNAQGPRRSNEAIMIIKKLGTDIKLIIWDLSVWGFLDFFNFCKNNGDIIIALILICAVVFEMTGGRCWDTQTQGFFKTRIISSISIVRIWLASVVIDGLS